VHYEVDESNVVAVSDIYWRASKVGHALEENFICKIPRITFGFKVSLSALGRVEGNFLPHF